MSDTPRVGIEIAIDAGAAEAGLGRIDAAVNRTGRTLDSLADRGSTAMDSVGSGSATAAGRLDAATRSMISSIQRTTAALDAGSRSSRGYYEALASQRGIDVGSLRPYLDQLEQVSARQRSAGISAGQMSAAMHGVPAQITDIVTSLQGGQQPLTVFLQQGGQLRDMFGSAGGAARALGSTLFGMINPLTVGAAAALALAVAYNQGSREADAYNRALIMTGNVAGTTAGQLADMAREISASVGTRGDAAEALAALAGTGEVAAANLENYGEIAVRAQKAIGTSVADTAKAFADLGKSPLAASEKLNDQYRYLTAAVYEQIRALERQGRVEEAAEVAQGAYASAMDERSRAIQSNLGTIERAWDSVKGVAKGAWDTMLNIGREQTLDEKLTDVAGKIAAQQKRLYSFIEAPNARAQIERLREEQALLQSQQREQAKANETQAQANRLNAAQIEFSKEVQKYLPRQKQMQAEIAEATNKANAAKASQKELDTVLAGIREKYADKGAASAVKAEAAAYANLTTAIGERITATEREATGLKPLTESQRLQVALDEGIASGKIKLTAAHKALYEQQIKALAQNESVIESQKRAAQGQAEVEKLYKSLAAEQARSLQQTTDEADRNENLVRTFGMTKAAIEAVELARLEEQLAQRSSVGMTLDEIEHLEKLIDTKKRSAAALGTLEAREAGVKAAKEAEEAWKRTAASIEDSLTDALMRGFESGKSFAENLCDATINMFKTMILRPTIQAALQPVSNSLAGVFQSGGSAGSGSAFGSATDLISIGKTIYSGFSGGIASTMGGYIADLGVTFGSSAMQGFGMGMGMTGAQAGAASAVATGAGNTAGAAGVSAGSSFASAIPVIGWIIAGMNMSNSLYKQGWDFNNGSVNKLGQNLGSGINLVDQLARKLGFSNSTANIISGLAPVSKLFGRRNPTIEEQGLTGTISASGFDGDVYANILEKGGIFRSDKRYTRTTDLTAEQDKSFDTTIASMITAVKGFGEAMGLQTSVIDGYNKQIKLVLTSDEAKNQEAIAAMFGGIADELSTLLLPTISKFSAEGEAANVTLQRIATNFVGVTNVMNAIGVDAGKAFGAVGVASIEARERLLSLAGGVESLATQTNFFAQNFLTEAERLAPVQKAVSEQMASLGYARVDTSEEFKAAVLGLASSGALATEAGAKTYASLLALAPAFKTVADAADAAAAAAAEKAAALASQRAALDIESMELSGDAAGALAARRALELAAMDASLRPLQERIYALQDEKVAIDAVKAALAQGADDAFDSLSRSVDAAKQVASTAHQAALDALQQQTEAINESISKTRSLASSLRGALSGASVANSTATRHEARAQITAALAIARAGGALPDAESLSSALSTLRADSVDQFSSLVEYQRDVIRTNSEIAALADITDDQLTVEEKQLAALKSQVDSENKRYAEEIKRFDGMLEAAKAQLDELNGIKTGVTDLTTATAGFAAAIAALKGGASTTAPGQTNMTVADLYRSALGREADAEGLAFWTKAYGSSVDPTEIADFLKAAAPELEAKANGTWKEWLKAHGIPGFAVGTNYVPQDMPAMIHEGERIVPAADNRALMQALNRPAQGNDPALLEELRGLREEVRQLKASSIRNEGNTGKTADLLTNVSAGGNAFAVEVMPT